MKAYNYKDSGIEWLGDIPSHWKADRIKDKTLSLVGGDWGSDPDSKDEGDPVIILRVADLDGINFSSSNLTIRKIKESSYESRKVTDKSLIIEKSGGGEKQLVGRVGNPSSIKRNAICSNFMANITFDNTVDISFMSYMFSCLYNAKLQFSFIQQTTGIQNLNVNYYLTRHIPIPPLSEQKAIVAFLNKATARIDRIISIKQQQLAKLEDSVDYKIKELVALGLRDEKTKQTDIDWFSEIPESWRVIRLKTVLSKIGSGLTPKGGAASYVDEGVPIIRSQNVKKYGLDLTDVVFIKEETHEKMQNSKVSNNDVLLNITGASLGRVCLAEGIDEANVNQHVCIIRPFQFITPRFLYYLLYSEIGQAQIFSGFKGSGREGLNLEAIKSFRLPLPPSKSEQNEITDALDILFKRATKLSENINSQINTLQNYRKSLIHECVTGKKQVTDRVE